MSKFDCALCGRDITDDGASFSSYLDGVKESRCPECGGAQGVDVEGLRAEVNALRAEVATLRRWEAYTEFGSEFFSLRERLAVELAPLRVENERLRAALADIARGDYSDPLCMKTPEQRAREAIAKATKEKP